MRSLWMQRVFRLTIAAQNIHHTFINSVCLYLLMCVCKLCFDVTMFYLIQFHLQKVIVELVDINLNLYIKIELNLGPEIKEMLSHYTL